MGLYPARSTERAMKFQEVVLRTGSKQVTWLQAGKILGMAPRMAPRMEHRAQLGNASAPSDLGHRQTCWAGRFVRWS
ncbi:MAG: hypothetical protein ABI837_04070 [Acidobacteriota bacterium]